MELTESEKRKLRMKMYMLKKYGLTDSYTEENKEDDVDDTPEQLNTPEKKEDKKTR